MQYAIPYVHRDMERQSATQIDNWEKMAKFHTSDGTGVFSQISGGSWPNRDGRRVRVRVCEKPQFCLQSF